MSFHTVKQINICSSICLLIFTIQYFVTILKYSQINKSDIYKIQNIIIKFYIIHEFHLLPNYLYPQQLLFRRRFLKAHSRFSEIKY